MKKKELERKLKEVEASLGAMDSDVKQIMLTCTEYMVEAKYNLKLQQQHLISKPSINYDAVRIQAGLTALQSILMNDTLRGMAEESNGAIRKSIEIADLFVEELKKKHESDDQGDSAEEC